MSEFALNPMFVRSVRYAGKVKRYRDGNGLYLLVRPAARSSGKFWIQRLTIHGRPRELGIGPVDQVSLKEARQVALENRRVARAGGDPRSSSRGAPRFADALEAVIAIRQPTWRGGDNLANAWRSSLLRYAFPQIGHKGVDAVTTSDVMAVVEPIWATHPSAARQVCRRIGTVMKWAIAQGYRTDNPAGDAVGSALPKLAMHPKPRRALPHAAVGHAVETVRSSGSSLSLRLLFEFQVLCAVRPTEARMARWEDIDLSNAVWTIPADRAKSGRAHRVPLSNRALAALREAGTVAQSEWVFPSPTTGRPFSKARLGQVLSSLRIDAVPHGFRSSFRDWAAECTDAPMTVMEAALAHSIRNATVAAYARSDLLDHRRRLMQSWADYVGNDARESEPDRSP